MRGKKQVSPANHAAFVIACNRHPFLANVAKLMRDQGMTKEVFARRAKLSLDRIEDILNGLSHPTADELTPISQALNTKIKNLTKGV
ncbi:hypothetical protein W02_38150 [Nitrospira sp. KM1]|uniref:helix-turn-helix domain-containing protein n=1 Tax=Nitrospira sp. KM1 TaxID=1936990 RepID=UPI0013A71676|nr:helix-turn-helix transcriptional regulator [Nitrospira sp. KM1]BCA56675.1 hypothetical protein W02_38150 [Nitrospira sp. KM1]